MTLVFKGRQIATDREGYLKDITQWSRDLAQQIAKEEGIVLTEAHWEVIDLLRQFYLDYDHAPAMRPLVKYVKNGLGEKKGTSIYLMTLFPGSPPKLAAKIAGLPRPANCL